MAKIEFSDRATKALFDALQRTSEAELAGDEIDKKLQADVERALAVGGSNKTEVPLIPVDGQGNPITKKDVAERLAKYGDNIEALVQNLAYVHDPEGMKWKEITSLQTDILGSSSSRNEGSQGGVFQLLRKRVTAENRIKELNVSGINEGINIEDIAKVHVDDLIQQYGVSYAPNGTWFGVIFNDTSKEVGATNYKVICIWKIQIGDYRVQNTKDPNDYTFTEFEVAGFKPRVANKPLNIEHGLADAQKPAQFYLQRVKSLRNDVQRYVNALGREEDPTTRMTLTRLNKAVKDIETEIKAMTLVTRMVGEEIPDADPEEVRELYRNLVRQGQDLGFHVVYRDSAGKISARQVEVSAEIEMKLKDGSLFFPGRAGLNAYKGATFEKFFKNNIRRVFFRTRSPSIFTQFMMETLSNIFEGLKSRKGKYTKKRGEYNSGSMFISIGKKKRVKRAKDPKLETFKRGKRPQALSKKGKIAFQVQNNNDLLRFINSNIENAVKESMVYPSLRNRTGRFASSVKAMGLTETQSEILVNFIYRKNPYSVFSMKEGKKPWATRDRDPENIIRQAMTKVVNGYKGGLGKRLVLKEGL